MQLNPQVRVQQMLAFIYTHDAEKVMLADIADTADISRSEAGRCFQACMGGSPVDALIQHRLQKAHELLYDAAMTLQELSDTCGFHSANDFSRPFWKRYGSSSSHVRG